MAAVASGWGTAANIAYEVGSFLFKVGSWMFAGYGLNDVINSDETDRVPVPITIVERPQMPQVENSIDIKDILYITILLIILIIVAALARVVFAKKSRAEETTTVTV